MTKAQERLNKKAEVCTHMHDTAIRMVNQFHILKYVI